MSSTAVHHATPYHLSDIVNLSDILQLDAQSSSSAPTTTTASSFDAQRAAAFRCEISELKDLVAQQRFTLDSNTQEQQKQRSTLHQIKTKLKAVNASQLQAVQDNAVRDTEHTKSRTDLEQARLRFRNRSRTLKIKIDQQTSTIESLTAKCAAQQQARQKAEQRNQQSENERNRSAEQLQQSKEICRVVQHERDELYARNVRELDVNAELRSQVDSAALRESTLRETASTLAGFQQDLADACTATRVRSSELVARQSRLSGQLQTQQVQYQHLLQQQEATHYKTEETSRRAMQQERKLRKELEAVRVQMGDTTREHQKERDSHIKAQAMMRATVEKTRASLFEKTTAVSTLKEQLANAVEARSDMELGMSLFFTVISQYNLLTIMYGVPF